MSECIALAVLYSHHSRCPPPVLNLAQAAHRAGSSPACRSTLRLACAAPTCQPARCRCHSPHVSPACASRCIGARDAQPDFSSSSSSSSSHFHLLILSILSIFFSSLFVCLLCQWFACCFSIGRTGVVAVWYAGLLRSMSMNMSMRYGLGSWMDECMYADETGHEHTHTSIGISVGIRMESTCVWRALYHYTILHILF